jgi:hypothetical protein
MPNRTSTPQTVVEENYVKFQHEFIEFLFAHLVDMRVIFEGDLDALLVFISVSRYYLRDERAHPEMGEDALGSNRHLTLSRISEVTGVPRETARRKLKLLESKGLLEKGPYDNWRLSVQDGQPVIRSKYEPVWQRMMQRLVKLVRTLRGDV